MPMGYLPHLCHLSLPSVMVNPSTDNDRFVWELVS